MPKEAEPEEPLLFNVGSTGVTDSPYPDKYTLQWQVPHDNGKPIDYFTIDYYQVSASLLSFLEILARISFVYSRNFTNRLL